MLKVQTRVRDPASGAKREAKYANGKVKSAAKLDMRVKLSSATNVKLSRSAQRDKNQNTIPAPVQMAAWRNSGFTQKDVIIFHLTPVP